MSDGPDVVLVTLFGPLYRPHSGIAPRTPSNKRMTATGTCALEEPNRSEHTGPKRGKYRGMGFHDPSYDEGAAVAERFGQTISG